MRRTVAVLVVASFVGSIALGACGGDKGDSCDEEGKVGGECDDGFVCGFAKNYQTGGLVCLTQCNSQLECTSSEDCSGVGRTNLKGCRPK